MEQNSSILEIAAAASATDEPPTGYRVILLLIGVPLVAVTVIGNLLVILAWLGDARVRTPSNAYLASLALVDFVIGAIDMTLGLKYNYDGRWNMGVGACQFWLVSVYSTVFISSAHLVLIALDRHRIVFEGVSYVQNRPYSGVAQCVVGTWAVGFWIILPMLLDWPHIAVDPDVKVHCLVKPTILGTFYWTSLNIIFPGIMMVWLYTRIYLQLRRRWRVRQVNKIVITDNSSSSTVLSGDMPSELCKNDPKVTQKKDRKAFVTLGILIGIFLVCWTPYVVSTLARSYGVMVPRILPVLCGILGWVNSALNPIVYAVRNAKFRDAFKKILSPVFKCM